MATRSLNVQITGDAKPLAVATKKAGGSIDDVEKRGKKMGQALALGFAAAGAAAAGALVIGLKKSADAAVESEKSSAKLKAQLEASNVSYRAHAKEIDAVIQKHSRLAGVDDEDLQDAFTGLVRSTGKVSVAMKDMGLVTDIMRGKNVDAAAAGKILEKVHNGNVTGLKKLGIAIDPVTKAQDKLKESNKDATKEQIAAAKASDKSATAQKGIAELQKRFGGQAAAYGKTAAGAQDRFAVAMENVQEKLGAKLLPVLGTVANAVSKFLSQIDQGTGAGGKFADIVSGAFDRVKTAIQAAIPVVVEIFGRIKDAVQSAIPTAVAVFERLKGAITSVVETITGLVRGFQEGKGSAVAIVSVVVAATAAFTAYQIALVATSTATKVVAAVTKAYTAVQAALNVVMSANPIALVALALVGLGAALVVAYKKSETFRGIVDGAFKAVKETVGSVMNWLVPKVQTAFEVVSTVVGHVVSVVKGYIGGLVTVVRGMVRVVKGVIDGDFSEAWDGVKTVVRGALKSLSSVIRGVWEPLGKAMVSLGKALIRSIVDGLSALPGALKDAVVSSVEWAAKNVPKLIGKSLKGLGGAISGGIEAGFKKLNPFGDGFGDGTGIVPGGGGAGIGGGALMGASSIMSPFVSMAGRFGLHTSSGLRPGAITSSGNKSFHGSGNAVDEAGTPEGMLGYFRYLKAKFGSRLRELIYTPGGQGIKDGKPFTYTGQVAKDHFDHVHVAFTGGAGDGPGDDRKKQLNWMQGVWGRVAPALGKTAGAVPSYFNKVRMDNRVPFAGVAWDSEARKGTPDLLWPRWVWADTPGQKALDGKTKAQLFVHEMAHRFQRPGQVGAEWESEGGAEAFARREMDALFGGRVVGKGDPYTPFVHRVEKDKGAGWILGTQFGRKAGTGDGIGEAVGAAKAAGFSGNDLLDIVAIAGAESAWRNSATANTPQEYSVGQTQINLKAHGYGFFGGEKALRNASTNFKGARSIWRDAGGFGPWSTFTNGRFKTYLGQARAAIQSFTSGGGKTVSSKGGKAAAPSFGGFTMDTPATFGSALGGYSLGSQIGGISGTMREAAAKENGGLYADGGANSKKGLPAGYTPPESPAGPTAPDYIAAAIAEAALTPGSDDDIAAAIENRSYAGGQLELARRSGDPRLIAEAATNFKSTIDAVDQLTDALTKNTDQTAALAEQTKTLAAAVQAQTDFANRAQSTEAFQWKKAFADLVSGEIGGRGVARRFTPGTGVEVAF